MHARRATAYVVGVLAAVATAIGGAATGSAGASAGDDPWYLAPSFTTSAPAHLVGEELTVSQAGARGLTKDPHACSTLFADAHSALEEHHDGDHHEETGCTHGVDVFVGGGVAKTATAPKGFAITTPPGIPCYGSGPRVKVFYAYGKGRPNRLAAKRPLIREAVAIADEIYQRSAARVGATRHVKWAMSHCTLSITAFSTSTAPYDVFGLRRQLQAKHLLARREKALIFADSGGYGCQGIGELMPDVRKSSTNRNNRSAMAAAVQGGCFGALLSSQEAGGMVAAHELGHTLGAVQNHAPYSNNNGHCVDEWDVMCYDDGSGHKLRYRCGSAKLAQGDNAYDRLLDCGLNTYFNPKPKAGSYLATHWNIARSAWLATKAPPAWDRLDRPTVSIVDPPTGGTVGGVVAVTARASATTKRVSFSVNGSDIGTDTTGTKRADGFLDFSVTVDTRPDEFGFGGYANGVVLKIGAYAQDTYSRPAIAAAVTVTVSNPTVVLTSPTPYQSVPWLMPWTATASARPGPITVSLLVRRNGTAVVTAATDGNPADGFGGTADMSAFGNDSSTEVAAQVVDSGGTTVQTSWRTVQLPAPASAELRAPYDAPANHAVPMFATATPAPGSAVTSVEFWADGSPISTDSAAAFVASLPAGRATPGDHTLDVWTNESNGRRTHSSSAPLTVHPDVGMTLSGTTDGALLSRTGSVALSSSWTPSAGTDPYVQFQVGDSFEYDVDGAPWTGSVALSGESAGPAIAQATGLSDLPDGSSLFVQSPALLVYLQ